MYKKYSDIFHENGRVYNKRVDRLRQGRFIYDLGLKIVIDSLGYEHDIIFDFYTKNILSNYIPSAFKNFSHTQSTPIYFAFYCGRLGLEFDEVSNFHLFVAAYECLDRIFSRFQYRGKSYLFLDDDKTSLFLELESEESQLLQFGVTKTISVAKGYITSKGFEYEGRFKVFMNENKSAYFSLTWNFLSGKVKNIFNEEYVEIAEKDDNSIVLEANITLFNDKKVKLWTEEENEEKILKGEIYNEKGELDYTGKILEKSVLCEKKEKGYCYILLTKPLNNIQFNILKVDNYESKNGMELLQGVYYSYLSQRKLEGEFTVENLSLINTSEIKENFWNKSGVWGENYDNGIYLSEFKNLSKISRVVIRTLYNHANRKNHDFIEEIEFYNIVKARMKKLKNSVKEATISTQL